MKLALIVIVGLLSFVGALVGALAVTGNLNAESLGKLIASEPEEMVSEEPPDALAPWAEAMKKREEAVAAREADVAERETRLEQERRDLEQYGSEVAANLEQIQTLLNTEDSSQGERIAETAKTLESMKPDTAAESMAAFEPEESAAILALIKERTRGKILDAMDENQRTMILRAMQEPKV